MYRYIFSNKQNFLFISFTFKTEGCLSRLFVSHMLNLNVNRKGKVVLSKKWPHLHFFFLLRSKTSNGLCVSVRGTCLAGQPTLEAITWALTYKPSIKHQQAMTFTIIHHTARRQRGPSQASNLITITSVTSIISDEIVLRNQTCRGHKGLLWRGGGNEGLWHLTACSQCIALWVEDDGRADSDDDGDSAWFGITFYAQVSVRVRDVDSVGVGALSHEVVNEFGSLKNKQSQIIAHGLEKGEQLSTRSRRAVCDVTATVWERGRERERLWDINVLLNQRKHCAR